VRGRAPATHWLIVGVGPGEGLAMGRIVSGLDSPT
jgi:hypothetical protein